MANDLALQWLPTTLTVPAGTTAAAPTRVAVDYGMAILLGLRLLIPPGHQGQTGFAIEYAGRRLLPFAEGAWVVGDSERLEFDLDAEVGGAVSYVGMNSDTFEHTFYVLAHVDVLTLQAQGAVSVSFAPQ